MKKDKKEIKDNMDIWNWIEKHSNILFFFIITLIAIVIRIMLIKYISGDYYSCLKPWFNELKQNGGLRGLSKEIGNYTPPYMTILALLTYLPVDSLISIKIVSIIFDFIGAYAILKIVEELLSEKKYKKKIGLLFYTIYLFLPTVILNSSYWGQCDSIYTAFIYLSIYFLIKNDYLKAMIFYSLAFSFKFQAILILPLYVLMYISERKIKLKYFLLIPLTILVLSIPKIIYSHDILYCFKMYIGQSNIYNEYITLNFPNFYSIFLRGRDYNNSNLINTPFTELKNVGILSCLVIFITLAFFVYHKKIKFDKKAIIEFGLFSAFITTFFLPEMHERYFFLGSGLSILYLLLNKEKYYIPIGIELISLNGYIYFLFGGYSANLSLLSISNLVLLALYSKDMINKYFKYT